MSKSEKPHSYILKAECPDRVGIVAQVSGAMRDQSLFIEESAQFGDRDTGRFFMRVEFVTADGRDLSSRVAGRGRAVLAQPWSQEPRSGE